MVDEINFIDYEYSSVSYRGFDIGNHFAEYAGNGIHLRPMNLGSQWNKCWVYIYILLGDGWGSKGFECDYSRYPSEDAQRLFLIAYLRCLGMGCFDIFSFS